MSCAKPSLEEVLKEAFTRFEEPLLFKDMLRNSEGSYEWKLFEWNFLELVEKSGDLKLPFRVGCNARSTSPQWEVHCPVEHMTLQEFAKTIEDSKENETWYYFDYKHMREWFKDKPEILASINWCKFGINADGSNSTLWIGNKGAHTNCHQDSYGYNLIAQIHGRKEWLLFPPSSTDYMEPIRIPYEESTIYSKFNFFCPNEEDEKKILEIPYKPKVIILEPGDVLFVPWGWWHYVESLDCSVSANIWMPLKTDSKMRLKEAIVKLVVARVAGEEYVTFEDRNNDVSYYTDLVEQAVLECTNQTQCAAPESPPVKKLKHTQWMAEDLVTQYPNHIKLLNDLEGHKLQEFFQQKRERFPQSSIQKLSERLIDNKTPPYLTSVEAIVNCLCHPKIIANVAEMLLPCSSDRNIIQSS